MKIDVYKADDIGARSEQQDTADFAVLNDPGHSELIVLADGVGGQTGGAVASRLAVDTVIEDASAGAFDDEAGQRAALLSSVHKANNRIGERIQAEPTLEGMATTLVAAIVSSERVKWVSVGDSHLYLLRGGELRKLNEDHSYAAMLVKAGTYEADDPDLDQYRNVIASAVSGDEIKHIDLPKSSEPLEPGDILLAASDGLDTLARNHVEALLFERREDSAQAMSDALIEAVGHAGSASQDNTSVVVARLEGKAASTSVPPVNDAVTQRRTPQKQDRDEATEQAQLADEPAPDGEAAEPEAPQPRAASEPEDDPRGGRGNWAIVALVAMAILGGGAYWVLSGYIDNPGVGHGIFSTRGAGPSPVRSNARRHKVDCAMRERWGFRWGGDDCAQERRSFQYPQNRSYFFRR